MAYVLLAYFLGALGIHNFYAGRWKRGLFQLLLTFTLIGYPIARLWSIINIFTIHTDSRAKEMQPCKVLKYMLGILGLVWYFATLFVLIIGGITGYTEAMRKYRETLEQEEQQQVFLSDQEKEIHNASLKQQAELLVVEEEHNSDKILDYASQVYVLSMAANAGTGIKENQPCQTFLPLPEEFAEQEIYCLVSPAGRVALSGLDDDVKKKLTEKPNVKESEKGNIIITFPDKENK